MTTECGVIVEAHGELDRSDDGRRWHVAEGFVRHERDIDHQRDPATRPDMDGCAAAGDTNQGIAYRARQADRVFGNTGPQASSRARHEKHGGKRRLAILANAFDDLADGIRHW